MDLLLERRTLTPAIPWWIAILIGCYAFVLPAFALSWTVDDAYITLRYARNLVEHGALTWNIGDPPVEGYTGLLWTLLAAAAIWARLPPLFVLDVAGVLCSLAVLGLAAAVLAELRADRSRRLLALGLLAAGPWWLVHAGSGLETPLFSALILACVLLALRRSRLLPCVCLLAALTRPEGAALALALAAASWTRGDRRAWPWWLFCGGLGLSYLAWRLSYYGEMLPNTYHAKSSGVSSWPHLAAFLSSAVLLPALAWWQSGPDLAQLRRPGPLALALAGFCGLLFVVYGRSELLMNYSHRFFVPLLPLIIIGLAATWGRVRWSLPLAGYLAICAVTLVGYGLWARNYETMERSEHAPAAAWIAEHAPAGATLAVVVDAGLVPYETGLRTIDAGALNDHFLARVRDPARRLDYFFAQRPDVVLLATGDLGIVAGEQFRAALLADPRWRDGYQLAAKFSGPQRFEYHQQVWTRR